MSVALLLLSVAGCADDTHPGGDTPGSGSGGPGYTALDSASALLDKYGTLSALMNRSLEEIAGIRGIRAARAIRRRKNSSR